MTSSWPIEYYTAERIPNPNPSGRMSWQQYHIVRNSVVSCCRRFGRTGPLGELRITDEKQPALDDWERGDNEPLDYWVVDDQYNDERYLYLYAMHSAAFTEDWLRALMTTLSRWVGWGAGMQLRDSYLLVFADRLMVTGTCFRGCCDISDLVARAQAAVIDSR